ncbi:uncharacterized protein JCM10292_003695 [Rhodotorula paludigena]|uniref:uncharacterized protein n=1 Tax=Rhodotorula paludigena TaxID=86838 RepID=UPI00317EF5E2
MSLPSTTDLSSTARGPPPQPLQPSHAFLPADLDPPTFLAQDTRTNPLLTRHDSQRVTPPAEVVRLGAAGEGTKHGRDWGKGQGDGLAHSQVEEGVRERSEGSDFRGDPAFVPHGDKALDPSAHRPAPPPTTHARNFGGLGEGR